jgi:hypothetical protein
VDDEAVDDEAVDDEAEEEQEIKHFMVGGASETGSCEDKFWKNSCEILRGQNSERRTTISWTTAEKNVPRILRSTEEGVWVDGLKVG